MIKKILIPLLFVFFACQSGTKPLLKSMPIIPFQQRYIIAVTDFENGTGDPKNDVFVQGIGDVIIAEFLKYNRFRIVEREKLSQVLLELQLEMSGLVESNRVQEVGKQLGVDALLFGNLISITHKEKKNSAGLAYNAVRKTEVILSARLVTVTTGEILASSKVSSFVKQKENVALGFAQSGNYTTEEIAAQSALDKAIQQLGNEIAAQAPEKPL